MVPANGTSRGAASGAQRVVGAILLSSPTKKMAGCASLWAREPGGSALAKPPQRALGLLDQRPEFVVAITPQVDKPAVLVRGLLPLS